MELIEPLRWNQRPGLSDMVINHGFKSGINTIINAELVIGNLSSNCRGNGICKMLPLGSSITRCSGVKASLVKQRNNRLLVLFNTSDCCVNLINRAFSDPDFIMDEAFTIPKWISTELSLPEEQQILAGAYPITYLKESALATFRLHGR